MFTILITNLTIVEDLVEATKMGTYFRWLWVDLESVLIFRNSQRIGIASIPIEFSGILQLLSLSMANSLNNAEQFCENIFNSKWFLSQPDKYILKRKNVLAEDGMHKWP